MDTASVGVVVIGRNEGQRLRLCLESVRAKATDVVYVDSGSADDSVIFARSVGVEVIELDPSVPFSAARARNAGLERLLSAKPSLEFVQFLDGDCEMMDGWLERGRAELKARPDLAVVFGRLRERYPRASVYNRLCAIEWDLPAGEVRGCGGIAVMRVEALRQVRGFDSGIIAAEDTELCARLRQKGWKILHVDADMAWHDAAMVHCGQWWRRAVRAGYGFAQCFERKGHSPERLFARELRGIWLWGCLLPLAILTCSFVVPGVAALLAAAYPVLALRVYAGMRRKKVSRQNAALYAVHCTLAKAPQLVGVLRYYWHRLWGKQGAIIEHKAANGAGSATGVQQAS
jgi:GT2 family glycosyltransferase